MINIRHVCLIMDRNNLEKFLNVNEWRYLTYECRQWKKVTLKVLGYTLERRTLNTKNTENWEKIQQCPKNNQTSSYTCVVGIVFYFFNQFSIFYKFVQTLFTDENIWSKKNDVLKVMLMFVYMYTWVQYLYWTNNKKKTKRRERE
jgi:hypothetical protein